MPWVGKEERVSALFSHIRLVGIRFPLAQQALRFGNFVRTHLSRQEGTVMPGQPVALRGREAEPEVRPGVILAYTLTFLVQAPKIIIGRRSHRSRPCGTIPRLSVTRSNHHLRGDRVGRRLAPPTTHGRPLGKCRVWMAIPGIPRSWKRWRRQTKEPRLSMIVPARIAASFCSRFSVIVHNVRPVNSFETRLSRTKPCRTRIKWRKISIEERGGHCSKQSES